MMEQFAQNISYRYRYAPQNGESGPLPVWSADALRSGIVNKLNYPHKKKYGF